MSTGCYVRCNLDTSLTTDAKIMALYFKGQEGSSRHREKRSDCCMKHAYLMYLYLCNDFLSKSSYQRSSNPGDQESLDLVLLPRIQNKDKNIFKLTSLCDMND